MEVIITLFLIGFYFGFKDTDSAVDGCIGCCSPIAFFGGMGLYFNSDLGFIKIILILIGVPIAGLFIGSFIKGQFFSDSNSNSNSKFRKATDFYTDPLKTNWSIVDYDEYINEEKMIKLVHKFLQWSELRFRENANIQSVDSCDRSDMLLNFRKFREGIDSGYKRKFEQNANGDFVLTLFFENRVYGTFTYYKNRIDNSSNRHYRGKIAIGSWILNFNLGDDTICWWNLKNDNECYVLSPYHGKITY